MKIQNTGLEGILQNLQSDKTKKATDSNFNALLSQELQNAEANALTQSQAIKTNINLVINEISESNDVSELKQNFTGLEDILNMLDNYTQDLANLAEVDNKKLWVSLNDLENSASELKTQINNPNLKGMLNELQMLASNEKFKLNRGDYL